MLCCLIWLIVIVVGYMNIFEILVDGFDIEVREVIEVLSVMELR